MPSGLLRLIAPIRWSSSRDKAPTGCPSWCRFATVGWFRGTGPRGLDFYVRQLLDGKASVEVATLDVATLPRYVAICAETLARAHARSGLSSAIAGYLGNGAVFDKALESFGMAYADQTIVDHAALTAAEVSGRITARRGI